MTRSTCLILGLQSRAQPEVILATAFGGGGRKCERSCFHFGRISAGGWGWPRASSGQMDDRPLRSQWYRHYTPFQAEILITPIFNVIYGVHYELT